MNCAVFKDAALCGGYLACFVTVNCSRHDDDNEDDDDDDDDCNLCSLLL